MKVLYKRPDGTFLAEVNGMPYHVLPVDPLFEAAALAGADVPLEPQPQQAPPDMADLRRHARAAVARLIDAACEAITGDVPEHERASWPTKADAARAVLARTAAAYQEAMIAAEAAILQDTPAQVAVRIVERADAWSCISGEMAAHRQIAERAIDAAADPAKVEAALAALRTVLQQP